MSTKQWIQPQQTVQYHYVKNHLLQVCADIISFLFIIWCAYCIPSFTFLVYVCSADQWYQCWHLVGIHPVTHNVGTPKHTPPYREQILSTVCAAKLLSVTRNLITAWWQNGITMTVILLQWFVDILQLGLYFRLEVTYVFTTKHVIFFPQ